jgi:CreA protein
MRLSRIASRSHLIDFEHDLVRKVCNFSGSCSNVSLACRQVGPIRFKRKFAQGEDVFRQRRSLFFKKMQIVRGCDTKRNVLVYMVYSDKLIEGSPKNSTSSVPVMPWGASDEIQKCADWVVKK